MLRLYSISNQDNARLLDDTNSLKVSKLKINSSGSMNFVAGNLSNIGPFYKFFD